MAGHTQLCGDAHLSNFGVLGSPERDLVFDVNDTTTIEPFGLTAYTRLFGATLARAHVYADQAEQDYGQLQQAITEGKIQVQAGIWP